jgi:hypothetical protein
MAFCCCWRSTPCRHRWHGSAVPSVHYVGTGWRQMVALVSVAKGSTTAATTGNRTPAVEPVIVLMFVVISGNNWSTMIQVYDCCCCYIQNLCKCKLWVGILLPQNRNWRLGQRGTKLRSWTCTEHEEMSHGSYEMFGQTGTWTAVCSYGFPWTDTIAVKHAGWVRLMQDNGLLAWL